MRRLLLLVTTILLISSNSLAAQSVEVEFSYSNSFESVRFYVNNDVYCEVPSQDITEEAGVFTFSCQSNTIPLGWQVFTLTAVEGGIESLHSPEFQWMKSRGNGPDIIRVK